jgi:Protein of unknown function (DUF2465)
MYFCLQLETSHRFKPTITIPPTPQQVSIHSIISFLRNINDGDDSFFPCSHHEFTSSSLIIQSILSVDMLATELQFSKVQVAHRKYQDEFGSVSLTGSWNEKLTTELFSLSKMLMIPTPDENDLMQHPERLLQQISAKLSSSLGKVTSLSPDLFRKNPSPYLNRSLLESSAFRASLAQLQRMLEADYKIRKSLLLERLVVTIESFKWSELASGHEVEMEARVREVSRCVRRGTPLIDLDDLFLLDVETILRLANPIPSRIKRRISQASNGQASRKSVYGIRMGSVPDRGGRVLEALKGAAGSSASSDKKSWKRDRSNVSPGDKAVGGGASDASSAGHPSVSSPSSASEVPVSGAAATATHVSVQLRNGSNNASASIGSGSPTSRPVSPNTNSGKHSESARKKAKVEKSSSAGKKAAEDFAAASKILLAAAALEGEAKNFEGMEESYE